MRPSNLALLVALIAVSASPVETREPTTGRMMDAIRVREFGGPEVLEFQRVPVPTPAEGELLVRVVAAGVTSFDTIARGGGVPGLEPPYTPGCELAGQVVALGGEVAGFEVGDPVFGLLPPTRPGAYAEFAVVRADEVAVFRGMSFAAAAGVPMAGLTAWQALFEHGRLEKGRTVLLVGDDWPVLNLAVQLARWRGAMVFVAAPKPLHDRLLELGADQVVDIAHERLEKVPEADLVIDLVGGKEGGRGWAVLKRGGRMVSLIDEPDEEKSRELGVEATRVAVQPSSEQLTQLASLLREQKIRVIDPELFTPAQAAKAHAKFEQAYRQGKLVIMAPKPPLHDPPHDRGASPIPRS